MQPAYSKDEFFDTISCNSLNRGQRNAQYRFSERMKLDTEVWLFLWIYYNLYMHCYEISFEIIYSLFYLTFFRRLASNRELI